MFAKWSSPEATFQILKELSRGQPCDFSGIRDYPHIDSAGGIQWPYIADTKVAAQSRGAAAALAGERRLFEDGRFFTPDGRARFIFDAPTPLPEPCDREYPLVLLTGRGSSAQWHTGSRTNKSAVLRKLAPVVLTLEINPSDAERMKIACGQRVRVRSRRGVAEAIAVITPTVQRGHVFLPMHFEAVNRLTLAAFDPHSRQPSYKACAVVVERL